MKQIRMIKGNDLFDWKVGDVFEAPEIDGIAWVSAQYKSTKSGNHHRNMIEAGH
jgi:hypothetical protein